MSKEIDFVDPLLRRGWELCKKQLATFSWPDALHELCADEFGALVGAIKGSIGPVCSRVTSKQQQEVMAPGELDQLVDMVEEADGVIAQATVMAMQGQKMFDEGRIVASPGYAGAPNPNRVLNKLTFSTQSLANIRTKIDLALRQRNKHVARDKLGGTKPAR